MVEPVCEEQVVVPVGEENTDRPNTATLSKGGRIKENLKPVLGKGRNENT